MESYSKEVIIKIKPDGKSKQELQNELNSLVISKINVDRDALNTFQEFLDKEANIEFDDESLKAIDKLKSFTTQDVQRAYDAANQELRQLLNDINSGVEDIQESTYEKYMSLLDEIQETGAFLRGGTEAETPTKVEDKGEDLTDLVNFLQSGSLPVTGNPLADYFINEASKLLNDVVKEIKTTIKKSWEDLGNMIKYSQLTDSSIRETKFTYGFSDAQTYGFTQALNLLGIKEEDLFFMNSSQWAKFSEKFNEYTERYQKIYDSGFYDDLQNFNWGMQEFEEDIKYTIMKFFVDNKDLIVTGLHALIDLTNATVSALSNILTYLTPEKEASAAERASAISQILNNQKYSSTKVNMNNTFNNTNATQNSEIINDLGFVLQQAVKALGGK